MAVMRGLIGICALVGCFSPSPQAGAPCGVNRECPDGLECSSRNLCERPGTIVPDSCATTCMGDVFASCGSSQLCTNGCSAAPEPHCRRLVPSNGVSPALLDGATADITQDKLDFREDGEIRRQGDVLRPAGEGVANGIRFAIVGGMTIWAADTWMLPAGELWDFDGNNPIVILGNVIRIDGVIDVGGSGSFGGPGGTNSYTSTTASSDGCQGRAGRSINATHAEGGGGGAGAVAGANGGASNQGGALTGVGGTCTTRPSTIPLRGGNGGGEGGNSNVNAGGGGGGAIALVAMESITIAGDVGAPGAGGTTGNGNGGGGGGGGGAILIEAPLVAITGRITANGGAGGAPSTGNTPTGARGRLDSATPAIGGAYLPPNGGTFRGGAGGAGTTAPQPGQSYNYDVVDPTTMVVTNYNRGGGGGGAAGRIEIKRISGDVTGLTSPPAAITSATIE